MCSFGYSGYERIKLNPANLKNVELEVRLVESFEILFNKTEQK